MDRRPRSDSVARPKPSNADVGVVVPAAGSGRRMGGRKKPYLLLCGEPVLLRALGPFLRRKDVREIVVALPPEDVADPPDWLRNADERIRLVPGGASRGESVRAGLGALSDEVAIVAVHDGARPLVDDRTVDRCLEAAREGVGAVAGWPAVDTVKVVDADLRVLRTPARSSLWLAHTPQAFPRKVLVEAYRAASAEDLAATDDASLVEARDGEVRMVRGSSRNIKVTRPDDLALAESYLRSDSSRQDSGTGGDARR